MKRTEWPKRSVENPEDHGIDAKECVSRSECSTDRKLQKIKSDKVGKERTGSSNAEVHGDPGRAVGRGSQ